MKLVLLSQMGLKLVLSNYLNKMNIDLYKTICLTIDIWFHGFRGKKDCRIDYCKLALYQRKMIAQHIGVNTMAKTK